jgi:hypothetical protein
MKCRNSAGRWTCLVLLSASYIFLGGRGYSGLHHPVEKVLPAQVFDMSPYDDVVELQSEVLSKYLNFTGSQMTPITKVSVACYLDTKNNHCPQAVPYEQLWYRGGDPIGSKQLRPLPVPERDQIAILLKPRSKSLGEAEVAACAGALVRLRLALSLNRNSIIVVRVPSQTMAEFANQLRKQNFFPYQEIRSQIKALVPITLENELGERLVTCFAPPDSDR